jgi:hypothetical protein
MSRGLGKSNLQYDESIDKKINKKFLHVYPVTGNRESKNIKDGVTWPYMIGV